MIGGVKTYVFLDAETDGLYGDFLSAALAATDEAGNILEKAYYGLSPRLLEGVKTPWVRENVLPVMGVYTPVDSREELLEAVWSFWMKYRETGYLIGDVVYPVEVRLLQACVEVSPEERMFLAPFPLLDISSMLYAVGQDPDADRYALLGEPVSGMQHNPLQDVETTIRLWKRYVQK